MMGLWQVVQGVLFYEFLLEDYVLQDYLICVIDWFVDLDGIWQYFVFFYSSIGCFLVDFELMICMLLIGYCFGIWFEWWICEEVYLNLVYCWFCWLDLNMVVFDYFIFFKNCYGCFCDSDLLCEVFEMVVCCCIIEGLVGGCDFVIDVSLICVDVGKMYFML